MLLAAGLVYTYIFERVDLTNILYESAVWIKRGVGVTAMDRWIIFLVAVAGISKHSVSVFVTICAAQLIWDMQQFLLSPAFRQNVKESENEEERELDTEWRRSSWWKRITETKVTLYCLMAPSPVFLPFANTSSGTWR